jgi:tetrahydrodipicolinate N-succinyltransferase
MYIAKNNNIMMADFITFNSGIGRYFEFGVGSL